MFPVVPVVELGTGPLTFELLPTFCPFQPVVLTFCAVLPVSQRSTIPQDRSSKRTDARNILSPLGSNFIWRFNRKETQKGLTEQVLSLQGHYSEREAEGKAALKPLFPRIADYRLQNLNVLCLPTLRAFGYVELNRLAFLKSAEAVRLNRCVVHKYILTICTAQKAEPLGIVEPLHCTLFHCFFLSKEMTLNSIGVSAGSADS